MAHKCWLRTISGHLFFSAKVYMTFNCHFMSRETVLGVIVVVGPLFAGFYVESLDHKA